MQVWKGTCWISWITHWNVFFFCFRTEQPESRAVDACDAWPSHPSRLEASRLLSATVCLKALLLVPYPRNVVICGAPVACNCPASKWRPFKLIQKHGWQRDQWGDMCGICISTLTWLHVCVFDLYKYIINIYVYIPWILVQSYVIVHLYTVFYVFIFVALENPWGLYQAVHVRRRKEYLNERSYSCQALMTLAIGLLGDGEISWNCCDSLIAWESIQLAKAATSCTDKYLQSGQRTSCFVGYYCST